MDIDSEISKKIQSAIKAKLIEINAYVDDELPDYIMIMIANRKAEDQMSDSLSLFLGDNAKIFTKWLYQLLATLCIKQGDKTEGKTATPAVKAENFQSKVVKEDDSVKKTQSSKQNRWDVQTSSKTLEQESTIDVKNKEGTPERIPKEAVIDILPEINDLFGDEILTANEAAASKRNDSGSKTKSTKPPPKPQGSDKEIKHKESSIESKKVSKTHSSKKKVDKKESDDKRKEDAEAIASNPSKKQASTHKRGVSIKVSKSSSEKISTSDKEHKVVKKKKMERSNDKESVSSHKQKSTKSSHARDWDKNKGHEHLAYRESYKKSRRSFENKSNRYDDKDDEVVPNKRIRSQISSSVSAVVKSSVYDSEDESDEDQVAVSKVISKVSIPERRPRLAPCKQANRSLLLKAVSEAESSIKKHRQASKVIEPISEKAFKTKVEEHKKLAVSGLPDRIKSSKRNHKETSASSFPLKLLRQTNLLHSSVEQTPENKESPLKLLDVKCKKTDNGVVSKSHLDVTNSKTVDERETETSNVAEKVQTSDENVGPQKKFGDTRVIVSRNAKPVMKKAKKSPIQNSPDTTSSVQFDSRKLLLKKLPEEDVKKPVKKISLKKSSKAASEDESEHEKSKPKRKKKDRSPSPCFIVTLDGTSASQKSKKQLEKESSKIPFQAIPVQAPGADAAKTKPPTSIAKSHVVTDVTTAETKKETSPVESSSDNMKKTEDDHTSDLELSAMRKQLLKMQEEARKLKEKQAKQQELIKQKVTLDHSTTKPNSRSIHVANVHFSASEKQLTEHFSICGKVLRVTILKDPFTSHPKGFAYLEFEEENSVEMAVALDGTSFCGRNISVSRKENEVLSDATYPAKHLFPPKRHRYSSSRSNSRYKTRVSPIRAWTRNTITRNKTWVKPGYIPS